MKLQILIVDPLYLEAVNQYMNDPYFTSCFDNDDDIDDLSRLPVIFKRHNFYSLPRLRLSRFFLQSRWE